MVNEDIGVKKHLERAFCPRLMQRAGVKQWCLRATFDVRIEVGRH